MNLPQVNKALMLIPAPLRRRRVTIPAAAILLLGVILLLTSGTDEAIATADVRHGEFSVSIRTSGEVRAANSFTLTTPRVRYGQMQIVYLIPEGTTVTSGDVVVRFATTEIDKTISDKESELSILESDLAKMDADISSRASDLEVNLKTSELAYAQAKLAVERMKFESEVARKESEINLEKSRLAFEQAGKKIEAQKVVDRSERKKTLLKLDQVKGDLQRAKADKEQFALKAPLPGLVVYETNWSTGRKIAIGDTPWPGMALVSLPDLSKMQSVTNVNEVDVSKVAKDQHVTVKLDAFPDRTFAGTVASVGTIGQQKDRSSNLKTFEVLVDIEGTDPVLKPGMTTSNDIVMETLPEAVFVPLESVFEKEGRTVVYMMNGSSAEPREVSLGAKNSNYVVITNGLEAGERVALRDPLRKDGSPAEPSGRTSL